MKRVFTGTRLLVVLGLASALAPAKSDDGRDTVGTRRIASAGRPRKIDRQAPTSVL